MEPGKILESIEPGPFKGGVVVIAHIVDPDNLGLVLTEDLRNMKPDKTGSAGDQNHESVLSIFSFTEASPPLRSSPRESTISR